MKRKPMSAEQRQALSEKMKAKWASLSLEERSDYQKKIHPNRSATATRSLTKFWAGCTGEARARRCAHLTNPEAQAKSHAAQRTPEFLAKRAAWGRAAWERKTPEERAAAVEKRRETMRLKRIARGLPPVTPRKSRARLSPEERLAVQRATMVKFWENHPEIRERAAAKRAALEKKRQDRAAERAKRIAERENARKVRKAEKAKKAAERERTRMAKTAERAKRIAEREKTRLAKAAKRIAERELKRQERAAALAKRIAEREGAQREKAAEQEKRRAAHPKPPSVPQSRRPRKRQRKLLSKKKRREINERTHCKPVIATPKKGGRTLRFGSARNAARTLLACGVTKNALGAQQKISLVCNGYRQSAFGYFWHFESCL